MCISVFSVEMKVILFIFICSYSSPILSSYHLISFYTCRYLRILIYIQSSSFSKLNVYSNCIILFLSPLLFSYLPIFIPVLFSSHVHLSSTPSLISFSYSALLFHSLPDSFYTCRWLLILIYILEGLR